MGIVITTEISNGDSYNNRDIQWGQPKLVEGTTYPLRWTEVLVGPFEVFTGGVVFSVLHMASVVVYEVLVAISITV
ncbi:hypothetical protein EB796_010797 [Bugula neritina]|uniref:Uncharacterized protein n=1 Tax=Bugula neritina TaxID=10212 RepID=A0A7J7JYZ9_BUGNE|nr:hypothetical protein EB796_010797 [Bugula neritina]